MTTDLSQVVPRRHHLSFSQLDTYLQCGEKYRLSYVEQVPRRPSGAFIGGRAVHSAIERCERGSLWRDDANFAGPNAPGIAAFLEEFDAGLREAEAVRWGGRGGGEDEPWWRKNGEFMMRRYRATREAMAANGWEPVPGGVEMKVLADLPGIDVPVVGYLDKFLMRDAPTDRETGETGEPLIADYKTGRVGGAQPFQFATYARLLEVSRGIIVRRGVGIYLRATEAAKRVQDVRFADLVPRVDATFGGLVRGIEAEAFQPNPNAFCSSCSVQDACWYWQAVKKEGER